MTRLWVFPKTANIGSIFWPDHKHILDAQRIPLVGPLVLDGRDYPLLKNLLILSLILTYSGSQR
jgi:hypothetical protein